jgi:hypothetical protein
MRAIEKRLRERIKILDEENKKLRDDRQKFRNHFENRFRFWLKLLGEQSSPSVASLVESDAKFMANVERWYW